MRDVSDDGEKEAGERRESGTHRVGVALPAACWDTRGPGGLVHMGGGGLPD